MYNVLKTGSKGNAVIYHNSIMIDCGIPFKLVKPYLHDLQIVLLTHIHKDHFNINTLQKMQQERPGLRIGCCEWLFNELWDLKNVDVYDIDKTYSYQTFNLTPIFLEHNVKNCGYKIYKDNHKLIHCTDAGNLNGIKAKDFDLFAIEHNYDEDKVLKAIAEAAENNTFCHGERSLTTHLSIKQAKKFIEENRKQTSEVLELHMSSKFY